MLKWLLALAAVLGLALLIAGGVLWFQGSGSAPQRFTLSNGSVLTFREATFGTNHIVSTATGWQRFVPRMFARWLGRTGGVASQTTPFPALMLWFHTSLPPGGGGMNYDYSLLHPDGTETTFASTRYFGGGGALGRFEGRASAYPQREKLLRVRVYDRSVASNPVLLGELQFKNPRVSRASKNNSPALPQIAREGDFEVALETLHALPWRGSTPVEHPFDQWTRAIFLVRDRGEPSTNWTVQRMEATDSTENVLVSQSWSGNTWINDSGEERERFDCQPVLWPSEDYKLRFEFSRKAEASFTTNETWTIRGVAVPTNGGFTLVNTQQTVGNFKVTFHGVSTKAGNPPWDPTMKSDHSLQFSVNPSPEGHRFTLLRVTDENDGTIRASSSGYSSTDWGFGIEPKGARTLNITVALHRSRFVEFKARPTQATRGK